MPRRYFRWAAGTALTAVVMIALGAGLARHYAAIRTGACQLGPFSHHLLTPAACYSARHSTGHMQALFTAGLFLFVGAIFIHEFGRAKGAATASTASTARNSDWSHIYR